MTLFASYTAEAIEVLSGLDPVKRRPGMYTDTTRPNHLAHEVVDNSVDEAIAGFADRIEVTLHPDDSLEVVDNGRGMPVDIHPEEKIPGVVLIMTRLHAGAKFSNKTYRFSGGLHGVGVSVVNALSKRIEVTIRRDGKVHQLEFQGGEVSSPLTETGTVGRRNTGTGIRFWPDEGYFDFPRFSVSRLRHTLRAKAVLCPGLEVRFSNLQDGTSDAWKYEKGLEDYLLEYHADTPLLPQTPFTGSFAGDSETVDWAVAWLPEGGEVVSESYVNLIPTLQGGTHVNGFRTGSAGCHPGVLRIPEPPSPGGQPFGGGCLGPVQLCSLGENAGPPVFRPDQGAPLLPPVRGFCLGGGEGRLQALAEPAHGGGGADRGTGYQQRPAASQGRPSRWSGRRS